MSVSASPVKSDMINSRMQEYLKNLNKDAQPVLKPLSSSRINSNSNLNATLSNKSKSPSNSPGKENLSKNLVAELSSIMRNSPTQSTYFNSPADNGDIVSSSPSKLSSKDRTYEEFLTRVQEAKEWIESIIEESLPSAVELATTKCMSDGVYLALLVAKVKPELVKKVVPAGTKLMYAHTQNINAFLELVDYVAVPALFKFELNDLYDRKNIPKVFETIHATASILSSRYGDTIPPMQNLTGRAAFSIDDIKICQRKLAGVHTFRSFTNFTSKPSSPQRSPKKGLLNPSTETSQNVAQTTEAEVQDLETPKTPSRFPSAIVHDIRNTGFPALELNTTRTSYAGEPSPQRLTYSPDRTFSYYSPGISRSFSHRTEDIGYFNKKRHQLNFEYDYYDTYRYGSSQYSPKRREKMSEDEFLDTVTQLQALLKGLNIRYDIYLKRITLKHNNSEFQQFQTRCKALLLRKYYNEIVALQNADCGPVQLQATLRGIIQRNLLDNFRLRVIKREQAITNLRTRLRGVGQRKVVQKWLQYWQTYGKAIIDFQALVKSSQCRASVELFERMDVATSLALSQLKAACAGRVVRLSLLEAREVSWWAQFQPFLKGRAQRMKIGRINHIREDDLHQSFVPFVKGYLISCKYTVAPTKVVKEVVSFNAVIKGMLTRFALELITDITERSGVNEFQGHVMGHLVRNRIRDIKTFYQQHQNAVVIIQKSIRGYQYHHAFQELLSAACPSLGTVRKYVHLLNHADNERFSTELQKLKSSINEINEEVGETQATFQTVVCTKDCLERRGIDVSKFLTTAGRQQLELSYSSVKTEGISKHLQALYGKVGFLLQVDSFYWRLLSKQHPAFCVTTFPKLFAPIHGMIRKRENILFVKAIGDLLVDEIDEALTLEEFFTEKDSVWELLLQNYLVAFKSKEMIGTAEQLYKYLDSPVIEFESDPSKIYSKLHPLEPPLTSEKAIEDVQTNRQFVKNMTSLWAAVELVCAMVNSMASAESNEIKYLISRAYRSSANKGIGETSTLRCISRLIIDTFLSTALQKRSELTTSKSSHTYSHKVSVLLDCLRVVFGFSEFEGYFAPLNQYLSQSKEQVADLLKDLLISPEEIKGYSNIVYQDMVKEPKPVLMIYHKTFMKTIEHLNGIRGELPHDDPIVRLVSEIEEEYDKSSINGHAKLNLVLDPSAFKVTLNNTRSDLMYNEAKQGVCYLMQVEEVNSTLTHLLVSETLPQDEKAFQALVNQNPSIRAVLSEKLEGAVSYADFKKFLLYRIKELTSLEILDKTNDYQFLLVDIANTIRTRSCIKELSFKEMELMKSVHDSLADKLRNNKLLLKAIETAISKSIKEIQSLHSYAPAKKTGLGSKLKDVYHKTHKNSFEPGAGISYKWSSKQLCERGVLLRGSEDHLETTAISFFGSNGPKTPSADLKISTSDGEVFGIELLQSKIKFDSSLHAVVKFTELIEMESKDPRATISIFEKKDCISMNVGKLLDLLVDSFFRF